MGGGGLHILCRVMKRGGGGGGGFFSSSINSSKATLLWEPNGSRAAPGSLTASGSLSGVLEAA